MLCVISIRQYLQQFLCVITSGSKGVNHIDSVHPLSNTNMLVVVVLCFANCVVLYFIVFFILSFNSNILFIYYNYTVQRNEQRCYTLAL